MSDKENKKTPDSRPSDNQMEGIMRTIEESGGAIAENARESFYCLSIIGQVEGHYILDQSQKATKYEEVIPLLIALEESEKTDGILVLLNTMGGDVEAGLAIAEVIASLSKPTVSVVLGGGHSIGVPLAVSTRLSFIVPSATMTIHPVRTTGTVIGAPQAFRYLSDMQDRILHFITAHSSIDEKYLREILMRTDQLTNDVGTVLDGKEAVACGLIDRIGGISDAIAALREMVQKDHKKDSDTPSA